jgi:outer membrane protein assembly factor BamE
MNDSSRRPGARSAAHALLLTAALTLLVGASGCVYRINVQQGNYLDQKAIDQVTPGMTRSQVRLLLGSPMVSSAFDSDRWDYVSYLKLGRLKKPTERKITVYFEGDKVTRIEVPQSEQSRVATGNAPSAPAEAAPATTRAPPTTPATQ